MQQNLKTCILLTGGKGTRIGEDKTLLKIYGQSLLETTYYKVKDIFDKIYIVAGSYNQKTKIEKLLAEDILVDIHEGIGTISGIYTGLKLCKSDCAFVTTCNMPLLNKKAIDLIFSKLKPEHDAVVPKYVNGKVEPLHSVYRKKPTVSAIEKAINDEKYSCRTFLETMKNVYYLPVGEIMELDSKLDTFFNINSETDLQVFKDRLKKKVYKYRLNKAKALEPKVKIDLETGNTIYFKVPGSEDEHEVLFNKRKNVWTCDCKYFAVRGNYCSHILAAQKLNKSDSNV